jgi:hypothetical protein
MRLWTLQCEAAKVLTRTVEPLMNEWMMCERYVTFIGTCIQAHANITNKQISFISSSSSHRGFVFSLLLLHWRNRTERQVVSLSVSCSWCPGLNLCPETGYPDWGFWWFSSVSSGKWRNSSLKLGQYRFLSSLSFTYDPFVRRYRVWATEIVVKWSVSK